MPKPLTAAAVAKLRPGKDRRELADGACPGLYLVIQTGGHKSWALRYRRPDGRPAKLVLGSVFAVDKEPPAAAPAIGGHLTLAAARRLVAALRHEIAQGRDVGALHLAAKRQSRATAVEAHVNAFAIAARDFITEHARKKVRRWKEQARLLGLQPEDLTLIPKGLAERWSARSVAEIDAHDIFNVVAETRERGAPGLERRSDEPTESRARAMFSCLSRMFRWLAQHRRVDVNPCAGVHRPEAPQARDRVLTNAELVKFWTATSNGTVGEPFDAVLRLLLLSGARLNEIAGCRVEELSEDGTALNIPGTRTKNHRAYVVPLAPLAREIIAGVPRIEGCPFLFSTNGRTPISGWSKIKSRLDSEMGVAPWRIHDLRRTAVTGMAELGVAPHVIELVVNHVSGARAGVAGVYNKSELLPERRTALERWAAHVGGLVVGGVATVVPIIRGRR